MTSPWTTWGPGSDLRSVAREVADAHERFVSGGVGSGVRPVVLDSWRRSRRSGVDPDRALPPVELCDADLEAYREAHPLAAVMPVVRRLLVEDTADAGLIVAVSDEAGRLLWVEGAPGLRSQAAAELNFVEGARWAEEYAGTNAPGTALALDTGVQIFASEHFARNVAPWSCAAAPIHDPVTGRTLGALDLTGGDAVAGPQTFALVRASVAAVEAELRLRALVQPAPNAEHPIAGQVLRVLGRDQGVLAVAGRTVRLSRRHTELLLLLADHPGGLTADQLAVLLYDGEPAGVTIRAEMSRLKAVVPRLGLASRPYRLGVPLRTDARTVHDLLDRGDVRAALAAYRGPVLPGSLAPAVVALRDELHLHLRTAVLARRDPTVLLDYLRLDDAATDVPAWRTALATLPPASPRRAGVAAHLARLDRDLG